MSKYNLTGHYRQTINFISSNDTWFIGKNAVVAAIDDIGIRGEDNFNGNKIIVHGFVSGDDTAAIVTLGEQTQVEITKSGTLYGAVDLAGEGSEIANAGRIISTDYGIIAEGGGIVVNNDGTIVANTCVFADEVEGTIVNGKHGFISAASTAFYFYGNLGDKSRIVNQGRIRSDDVAVDASSADDTVINRGQMIGDITFSFGNDLLDTRGGSFKGAVYGEDGDDSLITDNAKIHLIELDLEGRDTVQSTVSYQLNDFVERLALIGTLDVNGTGNNGDNVLTGNVGDNVLIGKDGGDTLDGGFGDDILRGGAGNDVFGFATGYGKDTVADFDNADLIFIANWKAIDNFSQLKAHAENHGADVWISAGPDTLIISDLHKSDLVAGDFQF